MKHKGAEAPRNSGARTRFPLPLRLRSARAALLLAAGCAAPPVEPGDAEQRFIEAAAITYRGLAALETHSLEDMLDAENRLPAVVRAEILGHARAGAAAARALVADDPDDADGHLLLALHLGFTGIAKGKVRAFLEGIPRKVIRAYEAARARDETVRAAGPLQVQGRFRTIVPFPYRDVDEAVACLERARSIAPVKQTLFFLGDAYAWQKRIPDARAAWRGALAAAPAPHAVPIAPLVDELLRMRLRACEAIPAGFGRLRGSAVGAPPPGGGVPAGDAHASPVPGCVAAPCGVSWTQRRRRDFAWLVLARPRADAGIASQALKKTASPPR